MPLNIGGYWLFDLAFKHSTRCELPYLITQLLRTIGSLPYASYIICRAPVILVYSMQSRILRGWSHSDWGGDPSSGRSTFGHEFILGSHVASRLSKRHLRLPSLL